MNPPTEEDYIEHMLDECYNESGWDKAMGIPTERKLTELNIGRPQQ